MEVKIGVVHSPREIVFESSDTAKDVESAVAAAVGGDNDVLALSDDRGRRILVPAARIGYVEIGAQGERRVGFGTV